MTGAVIRVALIIAASKGIDKGQISHAWKLSISRQNEKKNHFVEIWRVVAI
jgi:hypothetical protein